MRGTPPRQSDRIRLPSLAIYGVPATVDQKYPWYPRVSAEERRRADRRFAVESPRLARQRSRFREEISGARVVEVAGGRHYVFLTNPAEVARAVREFCQAISP
jgi:pimeloyl-ACP methyl ester carboxylesterase